MIYEIEHTYAVLPAAPDSKYHIEVNKVSWNDKRGKIDIRRWGNDTREPGKGMTITRDEVLQLAEILQKLANDF